MIHYRFNVRYDISAVEDHGAGSDLGACRGQEAARVGPGSVIEWEEEGGKLVVRRSGKYTFEDIRKMLFPEGPLPPKTIEEMDEGIRQHIRKKHARGRY